MQADEVALVHCEDGAVLQDGLSQNDVIISPDSRQASFKSCDDIVTARSQDEDNG